MKGRKLNLEGLKLLYNDNEIDSNNPELISEIERVHSNHEIPELRYYKSLGIYLDENLTFNTHFSILHKKLSRSIFIINRVKHFLPARILRTLYFSIFHSHLMYCPTILSCSSNSNIEKIFKLQKKVIRIITLSDYNAHTEPLFKSLKILPYHKLIYQANLSLMHSIHFEYSPQALHNIFPRNSDRNVNYNLRNQDDYATVRVRFNALKKFPLYALPSIWNQADNNRYISNPFSFKYALREKQIGRAHV